MSNENKRHPGIMECAKKRTKKVKINVLIDYTLDVIISLSSLSFPYILVCIRGCTLTRCISHYCDLLLQSSKVTNEWHRARSRDLSRMFFLCMSCFRQTDTHETMIRWRIVEYSSNIFRNIIICCVWTFHLINEYVQLLFGFKRITYISIWIGNGNEKHNTSEAKIPHRNDELARNDATLNLN